jgi:hypothetical protein
MRLLDYFWSDGEKVWISRMAIMTSLKTLSWYSPGEIEKKPLKIVTP